MTMNKYSPERSFEQYIQLLQQSKSPFAFTLVFYYPKSLIFGSFRFHKTSVEKSNYNQKVEGLNLFSINLLRNILYKFW